MNLAFRDRFMEAWERYFNDAELPIMFYYTEHEGCTDLVPPAEGHQCLIGVLARVRKGEPLCFDVNSVGC